PGHPAPVTLFELITANRIRQVVSEIGKQIEVIVKPVSHDLRRRMRALTMPLGLQAISLRVAAIVRIECAEEPNEGDCVSGNLIARVPFAVIAAGRYAESLRIGTLAVADQAVELVIVIAVFPRAIIVIHLAPGEQVSRTE